MIDPNIALSFRPPESPVEMQAKVMGLQNQRLQQQAAQQQLQQGALELQMKQRALKDQEVLRQALMNASIGSDGQPNDTQVIKTMMQGGASPNAVFSFMKQRTEAKKDYETWQKEKLANEVSRHDALRGAMLSFAGQAPDFQQQNWQAFVKHQVESGKMSPEEAAAMPAEFPGADALKLTAGGLALGSQWMKEAFEKQNADAATARAAAATQQAGTSQTRLDLETPGIQATNKLKSLEAVGQAPIQPAQQAQIDAAKAGHEETTRHNKVEERLGSGRLATEQAAQALREKTFGATLGAGRDSNGQPLKDANGKPLTGDAYLAVLDPGTAAQVKAIAEGRQTQLPRGKELSAVMAMVNQYDPSFSNQRAEIRKAFTTGPDARNIGNLNTAAVHLDQLSEAAQAMQNGSFRPGNEIWNKARAMFGSSLPTNFDGIKQAVAGEMANALKGQATDPEIAHIAATINGASSAQQLADIVNTHLHTLGAKLNTYAERYRQQVPDDKQWSPVLPAAQAAFQKHGVQPVQQSAGSSSSSKPAYQVGQTVMYNGAPHKIKSIKADGKLVLEQ